MESHLQTQRSAVKMLHERILVLIKYVTDVIAGMCVNMRLLASSNSNFYLGTAKSDPSILRSLVALLASLPASENKHFREEFDMVSPFLNYGNYNLILLAFQIGIRRCAIDGLPFFSHKIDEHPKRCKAFILSQNDHIVN